MEQSSDTCPVMQELINWAKQQNPEVVELR